MKFEVITMRQMLEALWNGEVAPGQTNGVNNPEMEHLTVLMDRNREELNRSLSQEQKDTFDKYTDCAEEFAYLSAYQAFRDGFSLASKLLTEAFASE